MAGFQVSCNAGDIKGTKKHGIEYLIYLVMQSKHKKLRGEFDRNSQFRYLKFSRYENLLRLLSRKFPFDL